MSRITLITDANASAEQKELLSAVQGALGVVPNFIRILANSPTALRSFIGLFGISQGGSLDAKTRERVALALAQVNACEYCLSAHTALGARAGLSDAEMKANREGTSQDAKAAAAVRFARALVDNMGDVTTAEIKAVRDVGFSDAEISEIIVHVGLNVLTNILGKASRVEIDFPKVALSAAA
jgi:uncharacterized peroxidase-related enzyme